MNRQYRYESSDSEAESETTALANRHHHRRSRRQPSKHASVTPQATSSSTGTESSSGNKKKKPIRPPQESIDQIWERFSQKKFSKALAVLPGAPVAASTSGERGNELLSEGYARAAEECRRKVRKIISECRRINTRYRDPGWDLDWDFKWEKGHCLNSLGQTNFNICHSALVNPNATIPKAVKRVHEIFEEPTFMQSVLPGDIVQGSLGNCWFVGSLTGLANVPGGVKRICVEYDTKIGIYGFVFYRDGEWIYSIIDDKLYLKSPCWDSPSMQRDLLQQIDREDVERVYRKTYQTGSKALFFAQNKDQNETWVPLLEKAYAKAHGDFACLTGGWIGEALEDLSGGVTTELLASDIFDTDAFWDNELSRVNQEFLFGCSTGLLDGGYGDREGIHEGHAYVVMEARTLKNGTRLCKLRNPWGKVKKGNWMGAWSDGSKEWTTEAQEELGHSFGGDSTFWISYQDLLRKYQHFDRTRLFRDADWRACQRWIGVEVPWKPQYHEKFHLRLTKTSPLVLVLAQLDHRYFRGLQGQYSYRLQFRLHEEGKAGAEEYVVRSHGNYLMDRSVSVELPSVAPGSYVVFLSIVAERNVQLKSTEDVIRRECKDRKENEKLAQVGQAYDFAHSKARAHLERLSAVRKKTEAKKASEARRTERRKNWEKREIGREVTRKQKAKDDKKKLRQQAAKRAAQEKPEPDNASTMSCTTTTSTTDTPQSTPQDTPKSEATQPVDEKTKVDVPDVAGGPPPPPQALSHHPQGPLDIKIHCCSTCNNCRPPPPKPDETDYASDSPVEDYERLYDDDDTSHTLRVNGHATAPTTANNSDDDEDTPDPWNAIAVVGFRVYSKDENLELRVVMEGGELEQDGMGKLGEVDLDNAVSNAAGQRETKKDVEADQKIRGDASVPNVTVTPANATAPVSAGQEGAQDGTKTLGDGMATYRTIVERKTSEFDRVMGKDAAAATAPVEDYFTHRDATVPPTKIDLNFPGCSSEEALDKRHKQVLYIRSMLQRHMMRGNAAATTAAREGDDKKVDMQHMSDLLATLEAYPDLEASVIRRSRVHTVLRAILKQTPTPGNDSFRFLERAQVLLDDYELNLVTEN